MDGETTALIHRVGIGGFVAALLLVTIFIGFEFIDVLIISVFLYYSVRPIHRKLARTGLSTRVRGVISLSVFGLPFVLLTVYALTLILHEIQAVLSQYDSLEQAIQEYILAHQSTTVNSDEIESILLDLQNSTDLMSGLLNASELASALGTITIQILLVLVLTYTMLVDGPQFRDWVIDTIDTDNVVATYAAIADYELSQTLFGNIVNVFITGVVGVTVFSLYNLSTPGIIHVPYPGLLGALTGFGSLIPLIGIKIVYIPVTSWLLFQVWLVSDYQLVFPVAALFVLSAVVVDFIPDTFVRAYVSGDGTHTPVLIAAYIMGPVVFGFYGLFLAPILLVLLITAGRVLIPYVLQGKTPDETGLSSDSVTQSSDGLSKPRAMTVAATRRSYEYIVSTVKIVTRGSTSASDKNSPDQDQ